MLIYCLVLLLLSCAINLERDKAILYSRLLLLSLLNCFIIGYNITSINFINEGIGIFGGLFTITALNSIFNLFIFFISILIVCLTSFYPRKIWIKNKVNIYKILSNKFFLYCKKILNTAQDKYYITEYSLILLFIIIGGIFLMASSDTISLFLSIELQSYGLYILSSIYRNSESTTSAGLTYFLLGALASCFILLATGLLYANSGCTYMDNLYIIFNISEKLNSVIQKDSLNDVYLYNSFYLHISFIILLIGFLFKVSAAPFHFWSPDVYDAVPTIVTTFIAILPKITIFIFILDLVNHSYKNLLLENYAWTSIFLVSSLLSLIIGTVLGLTQSRIKRLYAYSTISHVGFLLLALSIKSRESIQAFLFYLIQYSIANLNAFIILLSIGYSLYIYVYKKDDKKEINELQIYNTEYSNNLNQLKSISKETNNSPVQLISQMKGFFSINPLLSLSLAITLFSFAGVPPLIGFFAKYMVLSASIDNGYIFISIVAILTSVIGGVYYLAIIKQIFFETTDYIINPFLIDLYVPGIYKKKNNYFSQDISFNTDNIILSGSLTITISVLTSIIMLFIFMPTYILNVTRIIYIIIFNY